MELQGRIDGPDGLRVDLRRGEASRLGPVVACLGRPLDQLIAWKDGRVEVRFTGGAGFVGLPGEKAWSIW